MQLDVSLSIRRGPHCPPVTRMTLKHFSLEHCRRLSQLREKSDACMLGLPISYCLTPPTRPTLAVDAGDQSEVSQSVEILKVA
jgi:hypothetical protein